MNLLKSIKQKVKLLTGKVSHIRKGVNCNSVWYGNNYGGFYVHPDKLSGESIVYSFGIGEDISFDNATIDAHGAQVFAFDPTPKSINWIKTQLVSDKFNFLDFGIDQVTGFVNFNLPKDPNNVSGSTLQHKNVDTLNSISVPMKSFSDIIKQLGHTHIDVLKMDIEGSEYAVIESILSSPVKIDQILIEIHERFFPDGKTRTQKLLKSLDEHGYKVFGVSETFEEISFIRSV
jgi:FkbM family methyltransferase